MLILQGVRVLGYLFWTISDNWEWADGYGPKFGLVAVDRLNNLARIPRPSYHLFTKVTTFTGAFISISCPLFHIVLLNHMLADILISGGDFRDNHSSR